jgi:polyhydroxyalkanoate synthesis regulator phasin
VSESGNGRPEPVTAEQVLLAGIGWASLGLEAADALAEDLARRLGVDADRMRTAVRETVASWREDAERLGARGDELADRTARKLGLTRREDVDELELRVAQLEHRVRLLERSSDGD